MLHAAIAKLPMRNKAETKAYYLDALGFVDISASDFPDYLLISKDGAEIHFFLFENLNCSENYGQVYIRVSEIKTFYDVLTGVGVEIHPNGSLSQKPWGQTEFSLLDPNHNLLTFGEETNLL